MKDMTRDQFAQMLGFKDYETLIQDSESVIREGDIAWYITKLPCGHWAAWDEWELSVDRVVYFATRSEAVAFHLGGFAEKCRQEEE